MIVGTEILGGKVRVGTEKRQVLGVSNVGISVSKLIVRHVLICIEGVSPIERLIPQSHSELSRRVVTDD